MCMAVQRNYIAQEPYSPQVLRSYNLQSWARKGETQRNALPRAARALPCCRERLRMHHPSLLLLPASPNNVASPESRHAIAGEVRRRPQVRCCCHESAVHRAAAARRVVVSVPHPLERTRLFAMVEASDGMLCYCIWHYNLLGALICHAPCSKSLRT